MKKLVALLAVIGALVFAGVASGAQSLLHAQYPNGSNGAGAYITVQNLSGYQVASCTANSTGNCVVTLNSGSYSAAASKCLNHTFYWSDRVYFTAGGSANITMWHTSSSAC